MMYNSRQDINVHKEQLRWLRVPRLCPLHVGRVGTPFIFAEWRAMRTFRSIGRVKESYLLQLSLKESCYVYIVAPDPPRVARC